MFSLADYGVVLIIWSTAESAITMMAASVPVLRSLLRQKSKSREKGSPISKEKFTAESFTMQSQSTVVIESRRVSSDKVSFWRSGSHSRAASRDVANGEVEPPMGQILQVNEVAVEYHDMIKKETSV